MLRWMVMCSGLIACSACMLEDPVDANSADLQLAADGISEADFAKSVLNDLQTLSFEKNREYCGYFVHTPEGQLAATPAGWAAMVCR